VQSPKPEGRCTKTVYQRPLRFGLDPAENIQHRLRNISVVVNYFPLPRFAKIDVRDTVLDSLDLVSSDLDVPALDTNFVGRIPSDPNDLIIHGYLPR